MTRARGLIEARPGASFVTAVKQAASWPICWAHTADAKTSSSWVCPAAEFPSHGKWPRPSAPRWMHSSCASSAHPATKSSPWAHWPAVDVSSSTTTYVRALRVTPQQLRDVAEREGRELIRREAAYRGCRPPLDVTGKTVILVDDGLATGASMFAAVQALAGGGPGRDRDRGAGGPGVNLPGVRRASSTTSSAHRCPHPFLAVGESFWDFRQVSDEEVRELLATPTTGSLPPAIRIAETPAEVIERLAVDAPAGVPPREALEEIIGDARIVLIGESSHGTHEFYEARAEITKWLIEEKGFCAVAAEADWPDAYRVNRYVRGLGGDGSADEALSGFERFPAWMWRNVVVRDFVDWLHAHNGHSREHGERQTGFYGLDLYSLHRSMQEVIAYLDNVDPVAAARARDRYACFDHTSADDGQAYGFAAAFGAGLVL